MNTRSSAPSGGRDALPLGRFLDPREAVDAARSPLPGAVNIPLSELPRRMHELPPVHREIVVAGPESLAATAVRWLSTRGRNARAADASEPDVQARASRAVDERSAFANRALARASGGRQPTGRWRLWEPSAFLEQILSDLPAGNALDLACGSGRDAVYMAGCGWSVTAVDVLPDALEKAKDLAARYLSGGPPIRWLRTDLERDDAEIEGRFDLIACFRFLHRPLLARIAQWLRPGGHLVFETFTTIHRERYGKPTRSAFVLEPGELVRLAQRLEIRRHDEGWRERAHTARLWAQRPSPPGTAGAWTR